MVPEDGRVYTALSRVPPSVGTEMQSLSALGSPIAWLFAKPLSSEGAASNGFALTGGRFNYTAEVAFPRTGHSVTISLQFKERRAINSKVSFMYN